MRTFEYRLYPTPAQQRQLMACLSQCRLLYNEMLERLKAEYDSAGKFLWKYDLCTVFKRRGGEHVPATADGHWYALIACDIPSKRAGDALVEPAPDIGLDVGLRHFLTDSDGRTVADPKCYRESQARLRRLQRALARCKRGSRRRRKAARLVAQAHLKIARQRRDFLFKTAKPYAEGYGRIFVEDLNVAGLARNGHLAKSILDASWSEFFSILTDKAERAGHQVVKVPAHFTSQECSGCGELVSKSLSARTHVCPHCGLVADRDLNAARNILARGLWESLENPARAEPSGANGGQSPPLPEKPPPPGEGVVTAPSPSTIAPGSSRYRARPGRCS